MQNATLGFTTTGARLAAGDGSYDIPTLKPKGDAVSELYGAWSNNCRGSYDSQLYIMHAYIIGSKNRTLCGVRVQEIGEEITIDEIGCARCTKSKRLTQTPEPRDELTK